MGESNETMEQRKDLVKKMENNKKLQQRTHTV